MSVLTNIKSGFRQQQELDALQASIDVHKYGRTCLVDFYDQLYQVSATDVPSYFWAFKDIKEAQKNGTALPDYASQVYAPMSMFNDFKQMRFTGGARAYDEITHEHYFDDLEARGEYGLWEQLEPTTANIIEAYRKTYNAAYKITDFIYNKYYNEIPNNYLITLRKYPMPSIDMMFSIGPPFDTTKKEYERAAQSVIATATTYFGEVAGNNMNDILKFSFGTNWAEQTATISTLHSTTPGFTGFGVGKSHFDWIGARTNNSFLGRHGLSAAGNMMVNGMTGDDPTLFEGVTQLKEQYANIDPWEKYGNRTKGPVDVVMKTHNRDQGLNFSQDFSLKFEYSMKSLNFVNPRIAMLDIIGNMIMMGTFTGEFWGGATRFYGTGGGFGKQLGDTRKLVNGDYGGYLKEVAGNVVSGLKNIAGMKDGEDYSILDIAKNILGGMAKNFLGSLINDRIGKLGQAQSVPALLVDDPTGYWHVVLGNPLNPILMAGNMICDSVEMSLGEGLGYDDFPMEVAFTVSLKHGKPRDAAGIENMFNAAKGRFYVSPYTLSMPDDIAKRIDEANTSLNSTKRDPLTIGHKIGLKGKDNPVKKKAEATSGFQEFDSIIDTVMKMTR